MVLMVEQLRANPQKRIAAPRFPVPAPPHGGAGMAVAHESGTIVESEVGNPQNPVFHPMHHEIAERMVVVGIIHGEGFAAQSEIVVAIDIPAHQDVGLYTLEPKKRCAKDAKDARQDNLLRITGGSPSRRKSGPKFGRSGSGYRSTSCLRKSSR
ncbi:MAG: hypothetical protein ACYCTW_03290 [Sulfuricella sp.]